ncbi:MAG: GAF domain-containing protein, partial [Chloroflexi bacterium]|nr:GAF domain-containing protein [Chloroflexota bacterium]
TGTESEGVRQLSQPIEQGILGAAARTNTFVLVDDAQSDPRWDSTADRTTGYTTRSILATPIRRRDELLGVLEVLNKRGSPRFTEIDGRLLEVVANQAAIAIENARLFEQMVQSEQMSVIGRMAASIIHDLKKPMAVIRGFAELLANPDMDAEKRRTFSGLILEDVDRFLSMTQELLDYSRGDISLQLVDVQLGDWIERILNFLKEDMESSGVDVVTRLDYRGAVRIDAERMRRVLINIAGNAADAMSAGGTLTLATRKGDNFWELAIEDTGTGIPQDLRDRIFQPFVTSGKEHGTGLGLAIAREIVTGHGGDIRVETRVAGEEDGKAPGSTFFMRIPFELPDPAGAAD